MGGEGWDGMVRQIPDAGFCFALLTWNKRSEETCRRRDASIGNQCPVGCFQRCGFGTLLGFTLRMRLLDLDRIVGGNVDSRS